MLPDKVIDGAMRLLRHRVSRLVKLLNLEKRPPVNIIAMECSLVGDLAWWLAPDSMADKLATQRALEARRQFRLCVWDGECAEAATTDDGLCPAHAEEQACEEAEAMAELERGEIAGEDAG